ncbi:ABC transporter permease [Paraconexibacter sp.]|uniref:ABC transporter permease n=1 Tax=Paraconexibacter sp. TaxID=2949640 RepID=UPI003567E1DF
MTANLLIVRALMFRALNEITRVPGAAIPGVLAPTIFMVGLASVFGKAANLPGFTSEDFLTFIVPVGLLQGAGFTGAATGVNLARDIEQGWFDRLLLCPSPRAALLSGIVASAGLRSLLPGTFLFIVAVLLGVDFPGFLELLVAVPLVMGFACLMACWGVILALRFRSQQAAPLMQMGNFIAVLFSTSYAPKELLANWLEVFATFNPVTLILEGVRQGFVGQVTWADTWPAFLSLAGLLAIFGALAVRGLRRYGI